MHMSVWMCEYNVVHCPCFVRADPVALCRPPVFKAEWQAHIGTSACCLRTRICQLYWWWSGGCNFYCPGWYETGEFPLLVVFFDVWVKHYYSEIEQVFLHCVSLLVAGSENTWLWVCTASVLKSDNWWHNDDRWYFLVSCTYLLMSCAKNNCLDCCRPSADLALHLIWCDGTLYVMDLNYWM